MKKYLGLLTGSRGFRPRSDNKSTLFFGALVGVISGYYIFHDVLKNDIAKPEEGIQIPKPTDIISSSETGGK